MGIFSDQKPSQILKNVFVDISGEKMNILAQNGYLLEDGYFGSKVYILVKNGY